MERRDEMPVELPPVALDCLKCSRSIPATPEEMERYIKDDSTWPHCCGMKMAVRFPDGGKGRNPRVEFTR